MKISVDVLRQAYFNEFSRNVFISEDRRMIYHIGIIDYLQEWNFNKKIEHSFKTKIRRSSRKLISAVEPVFYKQRFLDSMKVILNYN